MMNPISIRPPVQTRTIPAFETLVAALDSVSDGVIITDAEGSIRYLNHAAALLTGWPAAEALRRPLDDVLIPAPRGEGGPALPASELIGRWRTGEVDSARFELVDRLGRRIPVELKDRSRALGRSRADGIILFRDRSAELRAEQAGARLLAVEETNRSMDRFLSMIAHEIRNPLTAISSAAEEIASREDAPDDMRVDAETLGLNAAQVTRLLRDLLDSRRSSTAFPIVTANVDLHRLVRQTLAEMHRDMDTKEITVDLQLDAGLHIVRADADRMHQVLWNLISNAVKFTPAGGRITIRSSNRAERQIRIEVTDTGIGIESEQLPQIFDLYYRANVNMPNEAASWGIGLAVSKAIADAHSGNLTAASLGRNCGSTFALELEVIDFEDPQPAG